jgi:hypothetical protein
LYILHAMDLSRISAVLLSLTNNQVKLPVVTNDQYSEMTGRAYDHLDDIRKKFEDMDDLVNVFRSRKCNNNKHVVTAPSDKSDKSDKSNQPQIIESQIDNTKQSPRLTLLHAIACINDPMLSLKSSRTDVLQIASKIIFDLQQSLTETPSKALDLAKQKLTKNGVRGILSHFDTQDDTSAPSAIDISCLLWLFAKVNDISIAVLAKDGGVLRLVEISSSNRLALVSVDDNDIYTFDGITSYSDFMNKRIEHALTRYKKDAHIVQKLKSMSIKDLRAFAKEIGVKSPEDYLKKGLLETIETLLI